MRLPPPEASDLEWLQFVRANLVEVLIALMLSPPTAPEPAPASRECPAHDPGE